MRHFLIALALLLLSNFSYADTYLDGDIPSNCSAGTYRTAQRDCGGSGTGDIAYKTTSDFFSNLGSGSTNWMREGVYTGQITISASGTSGTHLVIQAYAGEEQQVILVTTRGQNYNPDPSDQVDTSNSVYYYPYVLVTISGNYVELHDVKTYGMVAIANNHDSGVYDSDIGGGGPGIPGTTAGQGQTVMIHTAYNITLNNNYIHHSCWGESNANGSAVMGYDSTATIEYNTFEDTWHADIRNKDTGGQSGRKWIVRYNLFLPSTIFTSNGTGFESGSQDMASDGTEIYNNIFYQKLIGLDAKNTDYGSTVAWNNTFINCTRDIFSWPSTHPAKSYNNLHYHSTGGSYYFHFDGAAYGSDTDADYNVYYTASGSTYWGTTTTYSTWTGYGFDANSENQLDPDFVDANGTPPDDFKRSTYGEDMTGSSYGIYAGAYETGSEQIGKDWTASAPPGVASASINGTAASITFTTDLDNTAFANLINGDLVFTGSTTGASDLQSCSENAGVVTCTAASTFVTGETVTLSSSGLTGDELCDASSNCISSLSGESVTNNTQAAQGSSTLTGAYNASGGRPMRYNASGNSIGLD